MLRELTDLPPLPDLPDAVKRTVPVRYVPALAWAEWMQDVLIDPAGSLANEDHEHLTRATLGVLLTNEGSRKKGRRILGTASIGEPSGSDDWKKGEKRQQIEAWFGEVPDFIIRLDAQWIFDQARQGEPAAVLALVEHELYHCAQDTDEFGMPKFNNQTGQPKWTIRAHDVEEFVGTVRRYGAGAPADQTAQLVAAGVADPEIQHTRLDGLCGECGQSL